MSLQRSSQEPSSSILFPSDSSDTTKLQDAPPPYPTSPPFSPNRGTSDTFKLRNATPLPNHPPATPVIRKSSSTSTLVPLPGPLRMFKRQSRKPSLSALMSRPSIQSLKSQLFPSAVPELVKTDTGTADRSSRRLGLHHQSSIWQISPAELLPTPPGSEDEGYETDAQSQFGIKTPRVRSRSVEDEGYHTDVHLDIDLQRPTPIENRITSSNLTMRKISLPSCALCRFELKDTLVTYAFPTTAPAITARIRSFYPAIDCNKGHSLPGKRPQRATNGHAGNLTNYYLPSPTFCLACFEKFHALHICWTCGFTIHREEERVGYGWAWWHWGCMSCLLCRAPVSPPEWTAGAITLSDSPACRSCLRELRDLVYIERRRVNASRRGFSPPWRPDVGFGIECNNRAGAIGADGDFHDVVDTDNDVPAGGRRRGISGLMNRLNALDGSSAPVTQGARNSRMSWMTRKGSGNVSGGGAVGSRRVSPSHRLGTMVYPPLPKWMERLPGRRNASGGVRKV